MSKETIPRVVTPEHMRTAMRELSEFGTYYDAWWSRLTYEHPHLFVIGEVINFPVDMMDELEEKWKPLSDIAKFFLIDLGNLGGMSEPIDLLKELFMDARLNSASEMDLQKKMQTLQEIVLQGYTDYLKVKEGTFALQDLKGISHE